MTGGREVLNGGGDGGEDGRSDYVAFRQVIVA